MNLHLTIGKAVVSVKAVNARAAALQVINLRQQLAYTQVDEVSFDLSATENTHIQLDQYGRVILKDDLQNVDKASISYAPGVYRVTLERHDVRKFDVSEDELLFGIIPQEREMDDVGTLYRFHTVEMKSSDIVQVLETPMKQPVVTVAIHQDKPPVSLVNKHEVMRPRDDVPGSITLLR